MGQDLRTDKDIVYRTAKNSLLLADKLKLKSIAFPAIGTGVGGLSLDLCAEMMIQAVKDLDDRFRSLEIVQFVLFDRLGHEAFIGRYRKIIGQES